MYEVKTWCSHLAIFTDKLNLFLGIVNTNLHNAHLCDWSVYCTALDNQLLCMFR